MATSDDYAIKRIPITFKAGGAPVSVLNSPDGYTPRWNFAGTEVISPAANHNTATDGVGWVEVIEWAGVTLDLGAKAGCQLKDVVGVKELIGTGEIVGELSEMDSKVKRLMLGGDADISVTNVPGNLTDDMELLDIRPTKKLAAVEVDRILSRCKDITWTGAQRVDLTGNEPPTDNTNVTATEAIGVTVDVSVVSSLPSIDLWGSTLDSTSETFTVVDASNPAAGSRRYDLWQSLDDYSLWSDANEPGNPDSAVNPGFGSEDQGPSQYSPTPSFLQNGLPQNGATVYQRLYYTDDDWVTKPFKYVDGQVTAWTNANPVIVSDDRDQHWINQGYAKVYDVEVEASDLGQVVSTWLKTGRWAAGGRTFSNHHDDNNLALVNAPDGSPAIRSTLNPGATQTMNVRGEQLGHSNTAMDVVLACEVWMDSPRSAQSYIGVGHLWGARPNVTHTGGAATNHPDSWSMRAVQALNGIIRGYAYWSLPSSATSYGDVIHGTQTLPLGQWVTIELEVVQNVDPNASDGRLTTFVDFVKTAEKTNRVRMFSDTHPRGFGMLIRNNAGATKVERTYHRRWKLYTR